MAGEFAELQERHRKFVDARDWRKYQTPKNVSMALAVEAAELMELFQWQDNHEPEKIADDEELMEAIEEEVADIIIYCLSMGFQLDIDLEQAVQEKIEKNEERYDSAKVHSENQSLER